MTAPASFDLAGRVALVTGGNGGIGRGIALGFAQAGAAVAIFGRNAAKNAEVLAALKGAGARAMALAVDVTDRTALEPAFRRVEAELGPVDILVNNAGIANLSGGILQETAESWDTVIETQLNAVFLLSKLAAASMAARKRGEILAAASMAARKRGKIINLGSMYSYFGAGPIPSYSAAKGAIVQLTKSMAIELAPHGIQVNAIAPGWIETDMTAPVEDRGTQGHERRDPGSHARRPLGTARGDGWNGDLPGLERLGLRHWRDDPGRRRLRHPLRLPTPCTWPCNRGKILNHDTVAAPAPGSCRETPNCGGAGPGLFDSLGRPRTNSWAASSNRKRDNGCDRTTVGVALVRAPSRACRIAPGGD